MSWRARAAGGGTLVNGALTGGLVWLGFTATSTLTYTIFEGPPKSVWLLYQGCQLLSYLAMGGLIGLWA